jgi:membrane-bound serine protease (ClpP class)
MRKYFISIAFVLLCRICHAPPLLVLNSSEIGTSEKLQIVNNQSDACQIEKAPIDQRLGEMIHYEKAGGNLVGYLYIGPDHPIDHSTYLQIKFALEEYKKRNVIFVLLRLNTPGGDAFSAMEIAELLRRFDRETHIPVVGLVYNWALSSGAMIAYSCRFIAITENALMGTAEPVIAGQDSKTEFAPKKMIPALRSEFANVAKFYCRNPLIAEAMVDRDIVLVKRKGQIIQLSDYREVQMLGADPDQVITTVGKRLILDAHRLVDLGVADLITPITATSSITIQQQVFGIWPADQSQLFNYPFFADIPDAQIIYFHNWIIDVLSFLTTPLVCALLMIGLLIGIYLGIYILAKARFLALIGFLLILLGIFVLLLPNFQSLQFSWNWRGWNLPAIEFMHQCVFYLSALLFALIIIAILARFVTPHLVKKNRITPEKEGPPETKNLPLIGAEGEAFTSLHPGGKVLIHFHLYDALTDGTFIERGEKVIVIKIQGSAIVVTKK